MTISFLFLFGYKKKINKKGRRFCSSHVANSSHNKTLLQFPAYTCHGGWYENGASFVVTTPVTRDSTAARRYCFVSRDDARGALALARSATNCDRNDLTPDLVFDATATGKCEDRRAFACDLSRDCSLDGFVQCYMDL